MRRAAQLCSVAALLMAMSACGGSGESSETKPAATSASPSPSPVKTLSEAELAALMRGPLTKSQLEPALPKDYDFVSWTRTDKNLAAQPNVARSTFDPSRCRHTQLPLDPFTKDLAASVSSYYIRPVGSDYSHAAAYHISSYRKPISLKDVAAATKSCDSYETTFDGMYSEYTTVPMKAETLGDASLSWEVRVGMQGGGKKYTRTHIVQMGQTVITTVLTSYDDPDTAMAADFAKATVANLKESLAEKAKGSV